ncbi:Sodium-dependent phosphate transporter [Candidatus Magnetomorum sp. HK-1]|nr:Sodium-dependent phosphate transporter [Candidatus Magnetomorum sp. HK-1]
MLSTTFIKIKFLRIPLIGFFFVIILCWSAFANTQPTKIDIDWFKLNMELFGGLALFLLGLDLLSEGIKKAAGDTFKILLSKMTRNRFLGAISGAFITAVLNSSSITTVLVVGFISAGVMTLTQSVGVIMGANIGSTMTAQLLAFNISSYSLLPLGIGFFITFIAKNETIKHTGMMVMGLGLIFFGMGIMSKAMVPLRSYEPFLAFLKTMERPMMGVLAGAAFTALVQSSAATVGIAIAMASEQLLTLPAGIALALGANIGTCVTALLASIGKPIEAVRAAIVHVIFNVIGVLIWLPLINHLAHLATILSSTDGVPRQIANANTLFNVINTALFISFTTWFAKLAVKIYPERPTKTEIKIKPKFLDESTLAIPALALEQVRREFGRMGQITLAMLSELPHAVLERDRQHIETIVMLDDKIDILEAAILAFLGRIRQVTLTEKESNVYQKLITATVNLETLADVIETDLAEKARKIIKQENSIYIDIRSTFNELYISVFQSVELAIKAIRDNNQQAAAQAISKKEKIRNLCEQLLIRESQHIDYERKETLEFSRIKMSLIDKMRRIHRLARRIAKIASSPE